MNHRPAAPPVARTWRDIPQQVKPRAMSREGRRRLTVRILSVSAAGAVLAAAGVSAWGIAAALRTGGATPAARAAEAIGDNIEAVSDGVLDRDWVRRTLALPPGATLASVNPPVLRARVLAGGQVLAADVERRFPRTLAVHLAERTPVARVMAAASGGAPRELLVARDGVVYAGTGYDPAMIRGLPWLDGVPARPGGPGIARIDGLPVAAEFLARAELDAAHLYRTWQVVSLARLAADGLIEVRTADGLQIVFDTRHEDLFPQLARLDTILDRVPKGTLARIDLSLGPRVPVAPRPKPSS